MRRTTCFSAACTVLAATSISAADVIIDQPDALEGGIASQIFASPYELYSCSAFDDFTITDAYNMTALTVYGENGFGSGTGETAVTVRFLATPNLGSATIASATGIQSNGVLTFDLTGITLAAGTYWIAAQVERDFDVGGQWYWRMSTTTNGAQAMWHNPGGAFGLGTDPVSVTALGQSGWDMAFTLEGTIVPAPSVLALFGAVALRRRRQR
jgi:hypothetical protein